MTPQELIAALDSFGLYASEVMRELHGDFTQYVKRMEDAAQVLGDLTDTLKREVTEENWDAFADDEVEELVARIIGKPGIAVAMGKALFYRQIELGIEAAYDDAGATMACNMMDPCALEGVQAFIEKRTPNWHAAVRASTG